MTLVRSLLFALLFYPATALLALGGWLLLPFAGQRGMFRIVNLWGALFDLLARHVLGLRVRVAGTLPTGPAIVASKHESMFETLALIRLLPSPAFVLKAELAAIPLWGALARRYGVIPVEREGSTVAMRRMLAAARAAIEQGRPVLIFPEGSRVPPGQAPPLKPGVAGLYRTLRLPVVPVALDSGRLWPRRGFRKRAGLVTLRVGAPIPAGLDRDTFERRLHAAINVAPTAPA